MTLRAIVPTQDGLIIECGRCPGCRRTSTAPPQPLLAHDEGPDGARAIGDAAGAGQSVALPQSRVRDRHLRRTIASGRAPRRQHTHRLGVVVHLVGHALGGRAGERLLAA
jgi:hypothetical protein